MEIEYTPGQIHAARLWLGVNAWPGIDPERLFGMKPATVVRGIELRYEGGWKAFAAAHADEREPIRVEMLDTWGNRLAGPLLVDMEWPEMVRRIEHSILPNAPMVASVRLTQQHRKVLIRRPNLLPRRVPGATLVRGGRA